MFFQYVCVKLYEFFEEKINSNSEYEIKKFKRELSINYFTLGTLLNLINKNNLEKFDIIHDRTDFDKVYLKDLNYFKVLFNIGDFKFEDSKNLLQLQIADILAGATYYMFDNYKAYYRIEATHSNFLKEEYNFYEAIEKFIISNTNLLESIHIICDHSFEELQFKYRKKYIKIK